MLAGQNMTEAIINKLNKNKRCAILRSKEKRYGEDKYTMALGVKPAVDLELAEERASLSIFQGFQPQPQSFGDRPADSSGEKAISRSGMKFGRLFKEVQYY